MSVFGVLMPFGFSLLLFPCKGQIIPPPGGDKLSILLGSNATIAWSTGDPDRVVSRSWTFVGNKTRLIATSGVKGANLLYFSSGLDGVKIQGLDTLVLMNVNQSYDGIYRFTILHSITGSHISDVRVIIAVAPNVTFSCPIVTTLVKGDNFTCECRGEGGNPPADVAWYKDSAPIGKTGKEEQTLSLINFGGDNRGTYTCKAQSHVNATDEKSIAVDLFLKPNVTVLCSSPISVNEGQNVICECRCEHGNPPAECTWNKNNIRIGKIGMEVSTLNRSKVSGEDRGNYTCVGQSHVQARAEKTIKVIVYFKPTNTDINISEKLTVINKSITIMCTSEGYPKPNYTIYHDTKVVSTNNAYFIKRVKWSDAGTYKCIANNTLGNDSDSDQLKVTGATTIMPSSTTTVVPSSSTAKGPGDGGGNGGSPIGLIMGLIGGAVVIIVLVFCLVIYCKSKGRDNKRESADVNPNGQRVITNHYELEEEDHGGDAGAYDTVKQSEDGEGSQGKKKPAGDSLPPVYAAVNKENRQGNTLYASLDSDALRKPGSKKNPPETRNTPTEYASIDFIQTGKTPNAENA